MQENVQLKSMVNELQYRLQQYEQSNSEVDEYEEQSCDEFLHGECVEQPQPFYHEKYTPYDKAQSEHALSVSAPVEGYLSQYKHSHVHVCHTTTRQN